MFISKKEHQRIVAEKDALILRLKDRCDNFTYLNRLAERSEKHTMTFANGCGGLSISSLADQLPDTIPRLVDDHFGGKSFRHEATTRVVIVAPNGDVRYGVTKKPCDKGRQYALVQE